jgi:hypothetical protein
MIHEWVSYKLLRDGEKAPSRSNYYKQNREKRKEYQLQYYENNKQKILQYHVNFRKNHKEVLAKRAKKRIRCECGSEIICTSISNHKHSKKHLDYFQKNNLL